MTKNKEAFDFKVKKKEYDRDADTEKKIGQNCKQKNFEGCINVCRKAGETVENCVYACSEAVKQFCPDKTKLGVGTNEFNAYIETENDFKGWLLILVFLMIVILLVWRFIL